VAPDDIDAYEAALRQPPEARSPAQRLKVPSLATTPSHLHVARPLMTAAANQLGSVEQIVVLVVREPVVLPACWGPFVTNSYRIANRLDIVPTLPPPVDYEHVLNPYLS
jgi:hypothetical protein